SHFGRGIFTQDLLNESLLIDIAKYHHKSVAQIILRWIVQQNVIVIPRTSKPEKLLQNIQLFDFSLSDDEIEQIEALNKNLFTGHGKVRVEQDDMIV
ncbi:MAG: aldo/keto reductase, partial [Paludibacteraceae bacterium]|nr:aldo/keto reductase [Paludibacteraceae bacterium]